MPSVEAVIREEYEEVIAMADMNQVREELRRMAIAPEAGLGVAILVAWQHGLEIRHIPLERDEDGNVKEPQAWVINASDNCPYMFVHVPVRKHRGDKPKLVELGIMNQNADPAWFVYHEDGLIGTFSFQNLDSVTLTGADIREILDILAQQGVLMRANINNRQIQFKDLAARTHIEESGEKVYVRVEDRPLDRKATLPAELNREDVWDYFVSTLKGKSACNYCSVQALTPRQVTMHSAPLFSQAGRREVNLETVRNYQLGFTFAPFGDPRDICHFLAWDFPHINDLVMNMEPHSYSFSDLIRLVRVINRDIEKFCEDKDNKVDPVSEPVSGICNHWAGNSIYHQHYQFVRIPGPPLVRAAKATQHLVTYKGIQVRKFAEWPSPAFLITSEPGRDEDVMRVAERVAREWRMLSEGEDRSYGNGIAIKHHTQNTFVTTDGDRISAIFIPRDRRKIHTSRKKIHTSKPDYLIQKKNAGVLEMMGYFVIDDRTDFDELDRASPEDRKKLGDSWLSELAPDAETIREFEANIGVCLSEVVTPYEARIDEISGDTPEDTREEAWALASNIRRDGSLKHQEREHLYRELLSAVLESSSGDSSRQSTQ